MKRARPLRRLKIFQSAGGVVVDGRGRVLVVNQNHDSWSLPKGHLDPGETALQAARREILEEAGVRDLRLVTGLGSYVRSRLARGGGEDRTQKKRLTFFLFRTNQTWLRPTDPHNPEARWVVPARVTRLLTHPKDKAFFNRIWRRAHSMTEIQTYSWKSPLGRIRLEMEGRSLRKVSFSGGAFRAPRPPARVAAALARYFAGRRENFAFLRRIPEGTPFQQRVWSALSRLRPGRTVSYAEIARRAGRPRAIRAAANAVGNNPLCLVIPCHRVIGSNGSLGGYAYGSPIKRRLLKLEGVQL